jgi:hypothetical protein
LLRVSRYEITNPKKRNTCCKGPSLTEETHSKEAGTRITQRANSSHKLESGRGNDDDHRPVRKRRFWRNVVPSKKATERTVEKLCVLDGPITIGESANLASKFLHNTHVCLGNKTCASVDAEGFDTEVEVKSDFSD